MTALGRQLLVKAAKLYDLAACLSLLDWPRYSSHTKPPQSPLRTFSPCALRSETLCSSLVSSSFGISSSAFSAYMIPGDYPDKGTRLLTSSKRPLLESASVWIAAFLFRLEMVTPLFVLALWFISSATLVSSRLVVRYLLSQVRARGRNLREMVIVGTNPRAVLFARKIQEKPTLGYRVLGFVDQEWKGMEEFRKGGYPLASDFERLPSLLRERVVDEVVLALPMKSLYVQASRVAALCEEQGIIVRVLSDLFNLRLAQSKAESLKGRP